MKKLFSSIGTLLLSVWLVLSGLMVLLGIDNKVVVQAMPILAVAAGALLLVENRGAAGKLRGAGLLVLSVWLIFTGLRSLLGFQFSGDTTVLAVLALVAGALLAWQR
jgi:hypothetical protein